MTTKELADTCRNSYCPDCKARKECGIFRRLLEDMYEPAPADFLDTLEKMLQDAG